MDALQVTFIADPDQLNVVHAVEIIHDAISGFQKVLDYNLINRN